MHLASHTHGSVIPSNTPNFILRKYFSLVYNLIEVSAGLQLCLTLKYSADGKKDVCTEDQFS